MIKNYFVFSNLQAAAILGHATQGKSSGETVGTPKQSKIQEANFIPVLNRKARSQQHRKLLPTTGILLTWIGARKEIEQKSLNMCEFLTTLVSIDSQTFLLPHNCDSSRMIKIQAMLQTGQDYTNFMDITRTN